MSAIQPSTGPASDGNEIDLYDIGRTLSRQWQRILKITLYTTALAVFHVLFSRPQFSVNGSMYLGDAQSGSGASQAAESATSGLDFLTAFQSVSDVETQVELIQADALLQQAILETGLNSPIVARNAPNLRFWNWKVLYGKRIAAFEPRPRDVEASFATLAGSEGSAAAFDVVFGESGSYQISRPRSTFSAAVPVLSGTLGHPASGGGLSLVIQPVDSAFPPLPGAQFLLNVQPAAAMSDALIQSGNLNISVGGTVTEPTKVANLKLLWDDPYEGQRFVNQLMKDFIATQLSWKTESASVTEGFIASQLDNIRTSLQNADKKLSDYQSQTGILDVSEGAKAVIDQLSQYEVQQTTLILQQEALQQVANNIAHPQGDLNPFLVSETGDITLGQLSASLATAEAQLQTEAVQYAANSTEIRIQQATVDKLEDAIKALVNNDLRIANTSLKTDQGLIANFEAQLKATPGQSLQVIELTRSSDVFGQLFVLLEEKEEEAEVSKAATIIDTRVVTPAQRPFTQTKPQASITVLMGLFIGLLLGSGIVLAKREISGKFQTDDEIRRAIQLPVYGLIPKRNRSEAVSSIFSARSQSPFSEAFRLMRSNLYQSTSPQPSRVILITSASSADGKTTVAANLVKFLADDGIRAILIDGDLHCGRVHEALKLDQAPGLAEWLVTKKRPQLQTPAEQRFHVLTAGMFPPNPSELLNEPMLKTVFAELREDFDYIIVDCPPLPAVADTMSLGQHSDLTLSVVYIEQTPRRAFAVHIETINTLDRRHGMIINGVMSSGYGYGYGYGYGTTKRRVRTWSTLLGRLWNTVF